MSIKIVNCRFNSVLTIYREQEHGCRTILEQGKTTTFRA